MRLSLPLRLHSLIDYFVLLLSSSGSGSSRDQIKMPCGSLSFLLLLLLSPTPLHPTHSTANDNCCTYFIFHFVFRCRNALPKRGTSAFSVCVCVRERGGSCGGSTADLSPLNNGSLRRRRRRRWRLWLRSRSIAF